MSIEDLIWIGIGIIFLGALIRVIFAKKTFRDSTWGKYKYLPKDSLMTKSEMDFYWRLNEVVKDRYYIFPQVHLSALLDHRVQGQDWTSAFYHINGKSVDYVLCSKTTLQPLYAIELDDPTHQKAERIMRDIEVERIFEEANIPLVRFRDYKDLASADIAQSLANARKLSNDKSAV